MQQTLSFVCFGMMRDRADGKMAAALLQMTCTYRGMLAVRATGIRPLIPGLVPPHFRAFSVRKEPELEDNPYYNKYQEKIQKIRSRPEEFKARMEKRHESKKEVLGYSKQAEFVRVTEQQLEKYDKMATGLGRTGAFTKNKSLDSVVNLGLMRDKTGDEIAELLPGVIALMQAFLGAGVCRCLAVCAAQLWMKYYADKETISAVIPSPTYEVISARAQACPTFLFALPQKEGYEFFVGHWSAHQVHFTSLINIQQTHGESAPSQMILHHFQDLKEDKGIVLVTAELDPKFISVVQAQCLANQVQLFYASKTQETFGLVETFNRRPADFNHMLVIAELERSAVGPAI
ncbi:ATP synthase mitochondrial F1 complex assembly factor 1 isoform X3 [Syngnathus scovelli]|uniref:ATP synthase mitochondrial F1 complex assembly factor 1 isoform X3 n=1 Tax=Syngnathus scovelli TaxID=161590 RepID=UPI002110DE7B|nr:ATP synthase mitochondrial F1 complex assembly factor 1 isoform X3 [Syngnathus scovelli]